MTRRIAFLIRALTVGGAQRQLIELARGLHGRGWEVTVLTFYGGGALLDELAGSGVRVVSLEKRGRWDVLPFLARLAAELRRTAPAVLHSYMPDANVIAAIVRPVRPAMRVVWGVRASDMDLSRYDRLAMLSFATSVALSRVAHRIIYNSVAGRRFHEARRYRDDRAAVVPNGIDVARFVPDPAARARGRAALGLDDDARVIGIVARLDPMKDHETFLRAASLMQAARDDMRFVCVGDGPPEYRAHLETLAASLDVAPRITWVQRSDDLQATYNALDVLTLPSAFGEGFPNVVGEAMACGVPCVVSDVGDAAHVVGDPARVVPLRDPAALRDAWSAALGAGDDERQRVRRRIVDSFSIDALVTRTEQVLEPLVT